MRSYRALVRASCVHVCLFRGQRRAAKVMCTGGDKTGRLPLRVCIDEPAVTMSKEDENPSERARNIEGKRHCQQRWSSCRGRDRHRTLNLPTQMHYRTQLNSPRGDRHQNGENTASPVRLNHTAAAWRQRGRLADAPHWLNFARWLRREGISHARRLRARLATVCGQTSAARQVA